MRHSRSVLTFAAGLLALGGAAGCGIPFRSPTEAPSTPTPAPITENLGTVITPAERVTPIGPPTARIVTPVATSTVTVTLQTVSFDPALDLRPGDWSPDGSALVAYAVTGPSNRGPIGHLWTVDAASGAPLWDSGDIEELIGMPVAEWLPDGTLALARTDDMRVHADGTPAGEVGGIDGQVRYVDVSPDGQTIFAVGPDGAWLVGADGNARRVQADDEPDYVHWLGLAWRPDGSALAVNQSAEKYYIVDAAGATARLVGETPGIDVIDLTRPLWLGDAWVWFQALDVVVNAETGETQSVEAFYAITDKPEEEHWVNWELISPDRRYALVQDPTPTAAPAIPGSPYLGPTAADRQRATFLYDRVVGTSREVEPISENAVWSPTSDRFAVLTAEGLTVFSAAEDEKTVLVGPDRGARHVEWSPDGRWIVFFDLEGGLWLIPSDGSAGPIKVVDRVPTFWGLDTFWRPITWSLDSQRFAVAMPNPEAVAAAEEAAAATSAAAPAGVTPSPPDLSGVPANLVLVTIEEGAGE